MENSKPPENILAANLEEIEEYYLDLTGVAIKFIDENKHLDKYNRLEYNVFYRNLGNFYKLMVNTSHLDLHSIPIQERLLYAEKKEFAKKIKDDFRSLLVEMSELGHVDEESPFYQNL